MTTFTLEYLKASEIMEIERMRLVKFGLLMGRASQFGISPDSLDRIFDATTSSTSAQWMQAYPGRVTASGRSYYYDFARRSVQRKYNFKIVNRFVIKAGVIGKPVSIRGANIIKRFYILKLKWRKACFLLERNQVYS